MRDAGLGRGAGLGGIVGLEDTGLGGMPVWGGNAHSEDAGSERVVCLERHWSGRDPGLEAAGLGRGAALGGVRGL